MPGPEGRSTYESILFGGPDPLTPPWFVVNVRTMANPTGPWGEDLAANEQATTVGGRPARLRSAPITPNPDPSWISVGLKWDEHHEVSARFWNLDAAVAAEALATLHQDGSGAWTVGSPPSGLQEIARVTEDVGAGWYQDGSLYRDSNRESGTAPTISVTRTAHPMSEADLVATAIGGGWGQPPTFERMTVRGHPALVVTPGEGDVAGVGSPHLRVLWFESDHDVVVEVSVDDGDRAQVDRAVAGLRVQDDVEWQATLTSCTDVSYQGTISSLPSWATGGICPGYDLGSGG